MRHASESKTAVLMKLQYKIDYNNLLDKQIVEKILAEPHDEEAAAFLLYNRYTPLLQTEYYRFTAENTWYEDCVDELFMHLKGKDASWSCLAGFEWRSTFGYWLKKVARSVFRDVMHKLIENRGENMSIDNDTPLKSKVQIAVDGEAFYMRRMQKIMLMEAIAKLKDDDQRFVILKRLQGYSSKEIASLLQKKWLKRGIKKYNNKNELVIPDEHYIDVRIQRAKERLREIMVESK